MRRLLPVLAILLAFLAGFVILFAGQFGVSSLSSSVWIVPGLVLTVIGTIGLMPSLREPEQRAGLFFLYGSAVGLAFISSSPPPPAKSMAEQTIFIALPILWITLALGVIIWGKQAMINKGLRSISLALLLGLLVVYFSGSSGGTGGGSWERWIMNTFGVSLGTAEVMIVVIRKTVHFTYYGLLALLSYRAARNDKAKPPDAIGLAIVVAMAHAAFDEMRQTFAPDRTGQFTDVIIDMLGAIVFVWLGSRAYKQPVRRPNV